MSESPYKNLRPPQLIEQLEQRDRQLSELQDLLARQDAELKELRAGGGRKPADPLRFPDGQIVTQDGINELWPKLQKPSVTAAPTRYQKPENYRLLYLLGKRQFEQVTIAKVPMYLRSQLHQLHYWLERQASGEGRTTIKDWVFHTQLWRLGAVVMRTCPQVDRLPELLVSTSDDYMEEVLRQMFMKHLSDVFGWKAEETKA